MKKLAFCAVSSDFINAWQGAAMGIDAAYILPSPTGILVRLWELRVPLLTVHLPQPWGLLPWGLLISVILGLLLAIAMDWNPKLEKALYPRIVASQTIPTTAIAPLFILWFGYSIWSFQQFPQNFHTFPQNINSSRGS